MEKYDSTKEVKHLVEGLVANVLRMHPSLSKQTRRKIERRRDRLMSNGVPSNEALIIATEAYQWPIPSGSSIDPYVLCYGEFVEAGVHSLAAAVLACKATSHLGSSRKQFVSEYFALTGMLEGRVKS